MGVGEIKIVFCSSLALACTEVLLENKDFYHPPVQNWTLGSTDV